MVRILQIVEQLMQMHVQALKQLGVDLEEAAKKAKAQADSKSKEKAKPIEDMIPLLPREEFHANMVVAPLDDDGKKKSSEIN